MVSRKEPKSYSGATSAMGFKAARDGKDHINIYSMGATELGKLLSHFAHTPFVHPYYGPFYSMEGFWYFARSGFVDDRLRYLSGFKAKQTGKELPVVKYPEFKEDIIAANYQKIIQNPRIHDLMKASELPFDHYYMFGPGNVHVTPLGAEWLVEGFESIRTALKEEMIPPEWTRAENRYLKKK